jgi:hypothetical protein
VSLGAEDLAGVFGAEEDAVDFYDLVAGVCAWVYTWWVWYVPLTDICLRYSSIVCSRMGFEMAMPVFEVSSVD